MSADSFTLPTHATNLDLLQFAGLGNGGGSGLPPNDLNIPPKLRKRTKTGCLTCRKRRIKCGEERPTCGNCIKSKRHCEGYSQRLVFKAPSAEWPYDANQIPPPSNHVNYNGQPHQHQQQQPYGINRPIPPPISTQNINFAGTHPHTGYYLDSNGQAFSFSAVTPGQPSPFYPEPPQSAPPHMQSHPSIPSSFAPDHPSHVNHDPRKMPSSGAPNFGHFALHHPNQPLHSPSGSDQPSPFRQYGPSPNFDRGRRPSQPGFPAHLYTGGFAMPIRASGPPTATTQSSSIDSYAWANSEGRRPSLWSAISDGSFPHPSPHHMFDLQNRQPHTPLETPGMGDPLAYATPLTPYAQTSQSMVALNLGQTNHISSTQDLNDAAVEFEDDDYFDLESDEDSHDASLALAVADANQRSLVEIMRLQSSELAMATQDVAMRSYQNFIHPGILDFYRAEWVASPLKNPKTARVFAHFITATAPTTALWDRPVRPASQVYQMSMDDQNKHTFWTYTVPVMAMNNQVVLHAVLAISSLHIAKLQGASITPSFKHYAYSLKRLARCLAHPVKRHLATTLAATLLLGFYEVLTADHMKWNSHLLGAKQLLSEMDFRGMSLVARKQRLHAASRQQEQQFSLHNDVAEVDPVLVSILVGRQIEYDGFDISEHSVGYMPREIDLAQYDIYQDLYWWYIKQDLIQAVISGNPPLLNFQHWADCPPRAAVNRPEAVYGSYDHVLLILGRIADFTARDRKRKVEFISNNGGAWRPHPSLGMGPPPPAMPQTLGAQPDQRGAPPAMPQARVPPPFYGMAPAPPPRPMPTSYMPQTAQSQPRQSSADSEPELATLAASIAEWEEMLSALNHLQSSLGPAFTPLPEESMFLQPLPPSTPGGLPRDPRSVFGAVLQYQSYDMAALWAMIHLAYIILTRSHPHMPPAAMMAAGIAAKQTAVHATKIGQIAVGLFPAQFSSRNSLNASLNPSIGGAFCELSIPMFFAGVQFQTPDQRDFLVSRLRTTEKRTGWASVGMIAHGCETAWRKAFELGRGPPYVRRPDEDEDFASGTLSSDDRLRARQELVRELDEEDSADGNSQRGSMSPPARIKIENMNTHPSQMSMRALDGNTATTSLPVHGYTLPTVTSTWSPTNITSAIHPETPSQQPFDPNNPNHHQQNHHLQKKVGQQVRIAEADVDPDDLDTASRSAINLADRQWIHTNLPTRLHWAMGLLSESDDVR